MLTSPPTYRLISPVATGGAVSAAGAAVGAAAGAVWARPAWRARSWRPRLARSWRPRLARLSARPVAGGAVGCAPGAPHAASSAIVPRPASPGQRSNQELSTTGEFHLHGYASSLQASRGAIRMPDSSAWLLSMPVNRRLTPVYRSTFHCSGASVAFGRTTHDVAARTMRGSSLAMTSTPMLGEAARLGGVVGVRGHDAQTGGVNASIMARSIGRKHGCA